MLLIKRAEMTECGDFHSYFCVGVNGEKIGETEECEHSMGCNGDTPYLSMDGDTHCISCGIKEALLCKEAILFKIDEATARNDDDVVSLFTEMVWDRVYLDGMNAHQDSEEYKAGYQRFRDGSWDETADGPFWRWSDERMHPFIMSAYTSFLGDFRKLMLTAVNEEAVTEDARDTYDAVASLLEYLLKESEDSVHVSREEAAIDLLNAMAEKGDLEPLNE